MNTKELYIVNKNFEAAVSLPYSKSESNRLLILQALSGGKLKAEHLSDANDTEVMKRELSSSKFTAAVEDAGTAMRFLTAYFCVANHHKIISGSERMNERPVEPLVNALLQLGFRIQYLKQNGFLPIEILPINLDSLRSEVTITGKVSSQFISALMLIAWKLQDGLIINVQDGFTSFSYIKLTANLMQQCGLKAEIIGNKIMIHRQQIAEQTIAVGADWTNTSYWYSFVALSEKGKITLSGLDQNSAQGDVAIKKMAAKLGVETTVFGKKTVLEKSSVSTEKLHFDFTDNPDLAQTIIVLCAAKNIKATFSGLHTLRLKETDRIAALQHELLKFNVKLIQQADDVFALEGTFKFDKATEIKTYKDHRMAMAFAPLALINQIIIEEPEVVNKSYPKFWEEVGKL